MAATKTKKKKQTERPYVVRYQVLSTKGELTTTGKVNVTAKTPAAAKRAVKKLVVMTVEEPKARSLRDIAEKNRIDSAVENLLEHGGKIDTVGVLEAVSAIREAVQDMTDEPIGSPEAHSLLNLATDLTEEPEDDEDDEKTEEEELPVVLTPGVLDLPE